MFFFLMVQATPLALICSGSGEANKPRVATIRNNGQAYGMIGTMPVSGGGNSNSTIIIPHSEAFSGDVEVRLFDGRDRVKLPVVLLPGWHGGKDGWFDLSNVTSDDRTIRAKAKVNFANHPNVVIDRFDGSISISGKAGEYRGHCQKIEASTSPQF